MHDNKRCDLCFACSVCNGNRHDLQKINDTGTLHVDTVIVQMMLIVRKIMTEGRHNTAVVTCELGEQANKDESSSKIGIAAFSQ